MPIEDVFMWAGTSSLLLSLTFWYTDLSTTATGLSAPTKFVCIVSSAFFVLSTMARFVRALHRFLSAPHPDEERADPPRLPRPPTADREAQNRLLFRAYQDGFKHGLALTAADRDIDANEPCVVCLDNPRMMRTSPCTHPAVMCLVCAINVSKCPVCRRVIESKRFEWGGSKANNRIELEADRKPE